MAKKNSSGGMVKTLLVLVAGLGIGYVAGILWPGPGESVGLASGAAGDPLARIEKSPSGATAGRAALETENAELRQKLQKAESDLAELRIQSVLGAGESRTQANADPDQKPRQVAKRTE